MYSSAVETIFYLVGQEIYQLQCLLAPPITVER